MASLVNRSRDPDLEHVPLGLNNAFTSLKNDCADDLCFSSIIYSLGAIVTIDGLVYVPSLTLLLCDLFLSLSLSLSFSLSFFPSLDSSELLLSDVSITEGQFYGPFVRLLKYL